MRKMKTNFLSNENIKNKRKVNEKHNPKKNTI